MADLNLFGGSGATQAVPDLGQLQQKAAAVGNSSLVFVYWFFGAIMVALFLYWIYHYFFSFNKDIIIYRMTGANSKLIVFKDKYKYIRSKGILKMQLRDTGSVLGIGGVRTSIPPPKVINVNTKGKEFLIAIKVSEDEFLFPGLNFNPLEIIEPEKKDFDNDEKYQEAYNKWKEYTKQLNFQPMTSTDRGFLVNEIEERESRKSASVWALLDKYGSGILIVITLTIILVFWSNVTKPNLQMAAINSEVAGIQQETAQLQLNTLKAQIKFQEYITGERLPADIYPPEKLTDNDATPPK